MSTITREFTKEQLIEKLKHRIAVAAKYPDLEKAQLDAAIFKIALASLEAEAVAYVMADDLKDSSIISTPAYRDLGEAMERTVGDVVALYTAPPAPVSVPDEVRQALSRMDDEIFAELEEEESCRDGIRKCIAALRYHHKRAGECSIGYASSTLEGDTLKGINFLKGINTAAMLQGADSNSPVIPDGWVACSERMPETMVSVLVTGTWFHHAVAFWDGLSWCDLDFEQPVTHWMPLPAAPQQEVK